MVVRQTQQIANLIRPLLITFYGLRRPCLQTFTQQKVLHSFRIFGENQVVFKHTFLMNKNITKATLHQRIEIGPSYDGCAVQFQCVVSTTLLLIEARAQVDTRPYTRVRIYLSRRRDEGALGKDIHLNKFRNMLVV